VYAKWVAVACQSKRLQFQQSGVDASLGAAIYQNCTKRLMADPSAAVAAAASTSKPASPTSRPQSFATPAAASSTNAPCVLIASPATTSGANSSYSYSVQCSAGVTPNSMAIVTPLVNNPNGFAVEQGISSQSQSSDKDSTTFTFAITPGADTRRLSLTVPTASIEEKTARYYVASGATKDIKVCESTDPTPPADMCSTATIRVPVPKAPAKAAVTECPNPNQNTQIAVMLDAVEPGVTPSVSGTIGLADKSGGSVQVPNVATTTIQFCVNGKSWGGDPVAGDSTTWPTFKIAEKTKLAAGDKIVAQLVMGSGASATYSKPSDEVTVGSCKMDATKSGIVPTLKISQPDDKGMVTYSGKAASDASGTKVRICVNDIPIDGAGTPPVNTDGTFNGGTNTFKIQANDQVYAQTIIPDKSPTFGPLGVAVPISNAGLVVGKPQDGTKPFSILIGGVEFAGYSSQAQTTDAFLNIFYRGPESENGWSGWRRVRLTSTPSTTTNGIGTYIANPTGLTSYSYQNVGQAIDYVFGPQWRIPGTEHMYIIGSFGATTPLSTQDAPVTFVAPSPGTQECTTLVNRFSVKNGYNPGLTLNTATNPTTCLAGGYTDIAFTNQDRSNFLMKYGAGVRAAYPLLGPNGWATADVTLGQDAAVTGGYLHGVVFKVDAILPIPTGSGSSWLYLFGSTYVRLQTNENLSPLVLQTPPTPITVPSPTVFVLPLRQPNRDYFRIGVGLNINQLWGKAFGSSCPSATADTAATATKSATDTSTPAKPATPGAGGATGATTSTTRSGKTSAAGSAPGTAPSTPKQ